MDTPESSQVLNARVSIARGNRATPTYRLGQPLQQLVQSDLVDERLGERTSQHQASTLFIVEQVGRLELALEVVQRGSESIRDQRSSNSASLTRVFLVDGDKLGGRVFGNLVLDVLDIALVCRRVST